MKNFSAARLKDGHDGHAISAHVFYVLLILRIDFRIKRRAAHLGIAGGDEEDGDGIGYLDEIEKVGQDEVEPAGFRGGRRGREDGLASAWGSGWARRFVGQLQLEKIGGALCDAGLSGHGPNLERQIGMHVLVERPEADGIASVNLAVGGGDEEIVDDFENVRRVRLQRRAGVHDE